VCNTYKQNIKLSTGHATSQPVGWKFLTI
jgi:hypothetical protein